MTTYAHNIQEIGKIQKIEKHKREECFLSDVKKFFICCGRSPIQDNAWDEYICIMTKRILDVYYS